MKTYVPIVKPVRAFQVTKELFNNPIEVKGLSYFAGDMIVVVNGHDSAYVGNWIVLDPEPYIVIDLDFKRTFRTPESIIDELYTRHHELGFCGHDISGDAFDNILEVILHGKENDNETSAG